VRYVFTHFFNTYTDHEVGFTNILETFIAHSGPKFSYTKNALGNEFFIKSHDLLFEQGLKDHDISLDLWGDTPAFFVCDENSAIPFDLFAATFYMLSRYEEYMPHLKDDMGRFTTQNSLLFAEDKLNFPVVDIWAQQFLDRLSIDFPEIQKKLNPPVLKTILEVPECFAFQSKSLLRTLVESLLDLISFRLGSLVDRMAVRFGMRKDPYDVYDDWIAWHQKYHLSTKVLFLFARPGTHDRNINIFKKEFQSKIKQVSDYVPVSLLASFQSVGFVDSLEEERSRLGLLIHRRLRVVRQHHLRLRFPDSYRDFTACGYLHDYSLQFTDRAGYRAGTGFPFYFYDLSSEQRTSLQIHPVAVSESILRKQGTARKARRLLETLKKYGTLYGTPLTLVALPTMIDNRKNNSPWRRMFRSFLEEYDQ
jgi:hypothetical protein